MDVDFYKFTMGLVAFKKYRDVPVRYRFKNRTTIADASMAEVVPEARLREELDHVRTLRFTNTDLHYLRGTNEYGDRMFPEDYLLFLKDFQLPPYELVWTEERKELEFFGAWPEAMHWETIALSIINELYFSYVCSEGSQFRRDLYRAEAIGRLADKIMVLRDRPDITISDFGTRRRLSRSWQEYAVASLVAELPPGQLLGTSNVKLAMDLGLLPMGTSAHEMPMVLYSIHHDTDEGILSVQQRVLHDWWDTYGAGLSIALPDTFGSEYFFRTMTAEQAAAWKGLRQDSGDPIVFGERAIRFYESHGVDPTEKLIVFSDGLDVHTMLKIADHFKGRIKCTFGWGTNLTNDTSIPALSMVIKVVEANGRPSIKLSDNLAKASGDPAEVERAKRVFGYTNTLSQECIY